MSLTPFLQLDDALAGAPVGTRLALDPATVHHLTRVLRCADGAALELTDGTGWVATARLAGTEAVLDQPARRHPVPEPSLHVAQSLAKGRKLDEVVRVLTELGVDRITPLVTQRSVVRLDVDRAARLEERLRGVARSAASQARRAYRPSIEAPAELTAVVATASSDAPVLLAHPDAPALPSVLAGLARPAALTLLVGPEGGFSDAEVARATDAGARAVGLGPSVLRTEHAAAAACAVILAAVGRWGSASSSGDGASAPA